MILLTNLQDVLVIDRLGSRVRSLLGSPPYNRLVNPQNARIPALQVNRPFNR